MRLDLGFVLGYCLKHLCHSMSDIILDDIFDKKHCQQHSDARIYQMEKIVCSPIRKGNQVLMDEID